MRLPRLCMNANDPALKGKIDLDTARKLYQSQ